MIPLSIIGFLLALSGLTGGHGEEIILTGFAPEPRRVESLKFLGRTRRRAEERPVEELELTLANGDGLVLALTEIEELRRHGICGSQHVGTHDVMVTGCEGEDRSITIGGHGSWEYEASSSTFRRVDEDEVLKGCQPMKPPSDDPAMMAMAQVEEDMIANGEARMEDGVFRLNSQSILHLAHPAAFDMEIRYYYDRTLLKNFNNDHGRTKAWIRELNEHATLTMRHPSLGMPVSLQMQAEPVFMDETMNAREVQFFRDWLERTNQCSDDTVGFHHLITNSNGDNLAGRAFVKTVCQSRGFSCGNAGVTETFGSVTGAALTLSHELGHNLGATHEAHEQRRCPKGVLFDTSNLGDELWSVCTRESWEATYVEFVGANGQSAADRCFKPRTETTPFKVFGECTSSVGTDCPSGEWLGRGTSLERCAVACPDGFVHATHGDLNCKCLHGTPRDSNCQRDEDHGLCTYVPIGDTCEPIEVSYAFVGDDLSTFDDIGSAEDCSVICSSEPECKSWTYIKHPSDPQARECILKSTVRPNRVASDCCDSGVPCGADSPSLPPTLPPNTDVTCNRPSNGCNAPADVYTQLDCDGDGILDHECFNGFQRWLALSSSGNCGSWVSTNKPCVDPSKLFVPFGHCSSSVGLDCPGGEWLGTGISFESCAERCPNGFSHATHGNHACKCVHGTPRAANCQTDTTHGVCTYITKAQSGAPSTDVSTTLSLLSSIPTHSTGGATCGGTAGGARCKFPFTYRGTTYNECTTAGHEVPWCETENDGKWGECQCGGDPALIKSTDGFCLDARDRHTRRSDAHMVRCDPNNRNQQWFYDEQTGLIRNVDGLCLDAVSRNSRGGRVTMWPCDAHNWNQLWEFSPNANGQIKNRHGICLDASERRTDGGKVHTWDCDTSNANQHWEFFRGSFDVFGECTHSVGLDCAGGNWLGTGTPFERCAMSCPNGFVHNTHGDHNCKCLNGTPTDATCQRDEGRGACTYIKEGSVATCGGTADGARCKFPFTYQGTTYDECTTRDNDGEPWCYTEKEGKWGNCQCGGVTQRRMELVRRLKQA